MGQLITTLEERKEKITDKLSTEYSLNHISIEEYERLIKYSQTIETEKELQILEKLVDGYNGNESYDREIETDGSNYFYSGNAEKEHVTLLSSRKTTGPITNGSFINILGSEKIVITEKDLVNRDTTLSFVVLLGSVDIQVPDNVNVINKTLPLLSDVKIADNITTHGRKNLIIAGNVILGEIKVKVRKV